MMRRKLSSLKRGFIPLFFIFLTSCKGAYHLPNDPQGLALILERDVIYGKDFKKCVALFSEAVEVRVLYEVYVKLNEDQAKKLCRDYMNYAKENNLFPYPSNLEKFYAVSSGKKDDNRAVVTIFIRYTDGREEPVGNFMARRIKGRWHLIL